MSDSRPNRKGCWYLIHVWECAVCGRSTEDRERIVDRPRPDDPAERYDYVQDACADHFM